MKKTNELSVMKKAAIGAGIVGGTAALSVIGGPAVMAEELPANSQIQETAIVSEEVTNQPVTVSGEELEQANAIIAGDSQTDAEKTDEPSNVDDVVVDNDGSEDTEESSVVEEDPAESIEDETVPAEGEDVVPDAPDIEEDKNTATDESKVEDETESIDENTDAVTPPATSETDEIDQTIEEKEEKEEEKMIIDSNVQTTAQTEAQVQQAQDNTQQFMEAAQKVADNYNTGLTQKDIVDLYNKYVAPYHDASKEDDLFALIEETYADGTLSEQTQQAMLGLINFMRALCGLGEVSISQDYNHYAQAGTDYLADNNLDINHDAAAGVPGAEDADNGLKHSNLALGSTSSSVYDLLLSFLGDTDGFNESDLGHRRWFLDPNLKEVGFGASINERGKYLALYVINYIGSKPNDITAAWPNDGFFPIEALIASHTSTNDAFHISLADGYEIGNPEDIKVTITKDDGTSKEMTYTDNINDVIYDWFTVSTENTGSGDAIIFMPDYRWINSNWDEFKSFEENIKGFIGHSITITITGLTKDGQPTTLTYTINFFSLQQAVEQGKIDQETAQKVIDQINGIKDTGSLTWEDYDSVKGVEAAYNGLTDSQKEYVSDELKQKLTSSVQKVEELKANHEADQKAANAVIDAINKIPDEVTLDSESVITSARSAYEKLTQDQKNLVNNYQKLTKAEETLAALKQEQAKNQAAAQKVMDMINALPGEITLDNKADVEAARAAYDALNDKAEAMVSAEAKTKLASAEATIARLEKEQADKEAAQSVIEQINALPGVDEIELDDEAAIVAARNAYDSLTDDQKALVNEAGADTTLKNAEVRLAEVKLQHMQDEEAVKTVTDAINALPGTDALQITDKAAVDNAVNLYNALTDTQKAMMDESVVNRLNELQTKMEELIKQHQADLEAAQAVTDQINNLPSVIDRDSMNQANAANDAYNQLTDTQKALVDQTAVSKLEAAMQVVSNIQAADKVNDQINNLPSVDELTLNDKDAVKAAQDALNSLTSEQRQYVDAALQAKLGGLMQQIDVLDAENVTNIINDLKDVDDLTLEDKEAVQRASDAYDALSDNAKSMISEEVYNKLDQAEDKITDLEDEQSADQVETVIGSLKDPSELTLADKDAVYAARDMYNSLNDNAKSKVDPALVQKLSQLVAQMDKLVAEDEANHGNGQGGNGGQTGGGIIANQDGTASDDGVIDPNDVNTGIEETNNTGLIASILALLGIGGAGLFARKKRKANK